MIDANPLPLVLVADDDGVTRAVVSAWLARSGYAIVAARDGEEALRLTGERSPDLLLVDVTMPGLDGYDVCRAIQTGAEAPPPLIFLTAHGDTAARVTGLDAGAVDYIVKPFDQDELVARVRAALRTKSVRDGLARQAAHDPLTGLLNRRELDARAVGAVALAKRHGRALSCLMLDIDHFKGINDEHGHAAGDVVLHETARRLTAACRVSDIVARYGGEEFVLLLPETPPRRPSSSPTSSAGCSARRPSRPGAPGSRSGRASASPRSPRGWRPRPSSSPPRTRPSTSPRISGATAPSSTPEPPRSPEPGVKFRRPVADGCITRPHPATHPLVLVADDDGVARAMLDSWLSGSGYGVVEARDGEEALRLAGERSPDLLVVDLIMPGLDGYEVCRRIRTGRTVPAAGDLHDGPRLDGGPRDEPRGGRGQLHRQALRAGGADRLRAPPPCGSPARWASTSPDRSRVSRPAAPSPSARGARSGRRPRGRPRGRSGPRPAGPPLPRR